MDSINFKASKEINASADHKMGSEVVSGRGAHSGLLRVAKLGTLISLDIYSTASLFWRAGWTK